MAGMYGSFGDIKKVLGIILILVVVAFGLGYCKGYESGKSESTQKNKGLDWKN